jgi:methanogenic corrinoid protein MtbC1
VIDAGENIKAAEFAAAYSQKKPQVLGLSALLSSTALCMQDVIEAVRKTDPKAKIIVGGAPITKEFADKIGASGYAPNAFDAAKLVERLL